MTEPSSEGKVDYPYKIKTIIEGDVDTQLVNEVITIIFADEIWRDNQPK